MFINQTIEKLIVDMCQIANVEVSMWKEDGECLGISKGLKEKVLPEVKEFLNQEELCDGMEKFINGQGIFFLQSELKDGIVIAIQGEEESLPLTGRFLCRQIRMALAFNQKTLGVKEYLRDLLLGTVLADGACDLKEEIRCVLLVELEKEAKGILQSVLEGIFVESEGDYIVPLSTNRWAIIKAVQEKDDYETVCWTARALKDTLNTEVMVDVKVSYGGMTESVEELGRSYREAEIAMEVGKRFYRDQSVYAYNKLGIGRLIYYLPKELCQSFLEEVSAGNITESLEEEELFTVSAFFENDLNLSETARQLYLHRNTLCYRLEKIQKKTGLDPRKFEDALTFKIAVMIENHLKNIKEDENQ